MARATKSSPVAKADPPGPPEPPAQGALGSFSTQRGDPKAPAFAEVGVSGLKVASGYVSEEFLTELRGSNANKIYRQMSESDPIVRAVLTAVELILRAVDWRVEPADDSSEAESEAEFVESLLDDMSHTFADFIGEALSMLAFGWSYHEIVLKRRVGPDQTDGSLRSKFTDGRVGIRKLPIRSQDSLLRWEMQDDGGIAGLWQQPPMGGGLLYIPIERALLFRTTSKKNNPEGVSILRSAYRPWHLLKTIEDMEAIGIERELAGLPVVSVPGSIMSDSATAAQQAAYATWKKVARDLKFNQQGGVVKPSDTWPDKEGNPTSEPLYKVELLSTGGRRAIDTDPVVRRHQQNIARSALADFIMLGDQRGSYALSRNKAELFLRACESYLNQIAGTLNRFLLPRVWAYNDIDPDLMPELKPGRVAPVDLAEIAAFITARAQAGEPLFPNQDLSEWLSEIADMPAPPEDAGIVPDMGAVDAPSDNAEAFMPNLSPQQATKRRIGKRARLGKVKQ